MRWLHTVLCLTLIQAGCGEVSEGQTTDGEQACPAPSVQCGDRCIDPARDAKFCGAVADCEGLNAGTQCAAEAVCSAGRCVDLTPADLLECQNCSFESGLIGWTTWDTQDPYYPLAVGGIGVNPEGRFFPSQPSDGALALLTGFDGSIPGLISAGRIVLLPAAGSAIMTFDYRAGWDLMGYGASLDRAFMVAISDPPSQEVIGLETILIVAAGSRLPDTGLRQGVIDLTRFAGKSILIEFLWDVPEGMTGPAFFQLDNIEIRIQNV